MKVLVVFTCLLVMLFSACISERKPVLTPRPNVTRDVTQPVSKVEPFTRHIDEEFIDTVIAETELMIETVNFEPPVKQWADETLTDLKKYGPRLKNPTFKSDGVRLDCIMMIHDTLSSMNNPNTLALQSQKDVMTILESTKPGMIGMEGHDVEDATISSLAEAQVRMAKRGGNKLTLEQAYESIDATTPQDGVLMYMKKYPGAKITGTDPASLIVLSMYIGSPEIPVVPARNPSPKLLSLLDANLTLLRSYLSVVKTLEAAEKRGIKHSSIVIGGSHAKEIREYGKQLGVSMQFYQAIPEAFIKKEPHLKFP